MVCILAMYVVCYMVWFRFLFYDIIGCWMYLLQYAMIKYIILFDFMNVAKKKKHFYLIIVHKIIL